MKNPFEEIANGIYKRYAIANLDKIKVVSGNCRYNYKCHLNAVHEAVEKGEDKIAVTIYINGDDAIMHFLNFTKGKYVDNTLGYWSKFNDYYFVKWIEKDDFDQIGDYFTNAIDEFRKKLPWYVRILTDTRV